MMVIIIVKYKIIKFSTYREEEPFKHTRKHFPKNILDNNGKSTTPSY